MQDAMPNSWRTWTGRRSPPGRGVGRHWCGRAAPSISAHRRCRSRCPRAAGDPAGELVAGLRGSEVTADQATTRSSPPAPVSVVGSGIPGLRVNRCGGMLGRSLASRRWCSTSSLRGRRSDRPAAARTERWKNAGLTVTTYSGPATVEPSLLMAEGVISRAGSVVSLHLPSRAGDLRCSTGAAAPARCRDRRRTRSAFADGGEGTHPSAAWSWSFSPLHSEEGQRCCPVGRHVGNPKDAAEVRPQEGSTKLRAKSRGR